jgi:hypothetical protein
MGREVIGECCVQSDDPALADFEMEMAVKFIQREAGPAPRSAEVQIGYEDSEYGSYPVIVLIWDGYEIGYPQTYIEKCIHAYDRFELPEDIYRERQERGEMLREIREVTDNLISRLISNPKSD